MASAAATSPGCPRKAGGNWAKRGRSNTRFHPHAGDWRAAKVFRAGLEFNRPLIVAKATAHGGELPQRWGFLDVTSSDVVVSALKPGATAPRFSVSTKPRANRLKTSPFTSSASSRPRGNATCSKIRRTQNVENNRFRFDLGRFEIKTFELRFPQE